MIVYLHVYLKNAVLHIYKYAEICAFVDSKFIIILSIVQFAGANIGKAMAKLLDVNQKYLCAPDYREGFVHRVSLLISVCDIHGSCKCASCKCELRVW